MSRVTSGSRLSRPSPVAPVDREVPDDTPRFTVRLVIVLTVCIVAAFVGTPALAGWLSALIGAGVR